MLKLARKLNCPWNESTCSTAAENGQLELLQWARAHGCPWNEDTCIAAVRAGHLAVLTWAREHGCPWSDLTFYYADMYGFMYPEIKHWAIRALCS
jgi:hypothetical protein